MDIGKLIGWLISVGLILATMGTLGKVTATLRNHAAKDYRHGIISLGRFNRRLQQIKKWDVDERLCKLIYVPFYLGL